MNGFNENDNKHDDYDNGDGNSNDGCAPHFHHLYDSPCWRREGGETHANTGSTG